MDIKENLLSELTRLLAQRAEIDEQIARGRAMLAGIAAAQKNDTQGEAKPVYAASGPAD